MTGFCMYQKVRLPRTQPRRSNRTHTGTGAGRAPPGTVQVMLVSARLWEGSGLRWQGPYLPLVAPVPSPRGTGLCNWPGFKAFAIGPNCVFCTLAHKSVSVFSLPHFAWVVLPTLNIFPAPL